jgi:hypothetical protein
MKKWLIAALFALPLSANAYHMDVIEMELKEGCSFGQLMQIIGDFNRWGKDYGYAARVARPIQSSNQTSIWWMGTSENAEAFGKAWDAWSEELMDPESDPSKLMVRLAECTSSLGRAGYDVY